MLDEPNTNRQNTIINVVTEVLTHRVNVWLMLTFTTSARLSPSFMERIFSRIRSKIMIVALIEYPMIVNIHAIKLLPTERRPIEYTVRTTKNIVKQCQHRTSAEFKILKSKCNIDQHADSCNCNRDCGISLHF